MDADLMWAACLNGPADHTARRVFADLLQERGFAALARAFRGAAGRACVYAAAGGPVPEDLVRLLFATTADRNAAARDLLREHMNRIFDAGPAADAAAETYAVAWAVDDFAVEVTAFDTRGCHVRVTFAASGEPDEEHAFLSNSMTGTAAALIDTSGAVVVTVTDARLTPWGDEEP